MPTRFRTALLNWGPLVIYLGMIHLQSSRASVVTRYYFPHFDKLLHFCGYALLGVLFARAYETLPFLKKRKGLILFAVLSAAAYGVVDEIHQYFVPMRDGSAADAVFDAMGALFGAALWARLFGPGRDGAKNNGRD